MASLEWLNTPVSQRLRTIIFTEQAPVSKRWKVLVVSHTFVAKPTQEDVVLSDLFAAHHICARLLRVPVDRLDHRPWCGPRP